MLRVQFVPIRLRKREHPSLKTGTTCPELQRYKLYLSILQQWGLVRKRLSKNTLTRYCYRKASVSYLSSDYCPDRVTTNSAGVRWNDHISYHTHLFQTTTYNHLSIMNTPVTTLMTLIKRPTSPVLLYPINVAPFFSHPQPQSRCTSPGLDVQYKQITQFIVTASMFVK